VDEGRRDDKKSIKAKSGKVNLPYPILDAGQSRDHAARAVGVSGKSMDDAGIVQVVSEDQLAEEIGQARGVRLLPAGRACDFRPTR
jgi:hypothetical protein